MKIHKLIYESNSKASKQPLILLEEDDYEIIDNSIEDEQNVDFDDPDEPVNQQIDKLITFPLLIESDQELDENKKEEYVNKYADTVIENIEENKKFILSALNIYDLEIFYSDFDYNSNISFDIILDSDAQNNQLMNVIKRYFNETILEEDQDYSITVSPVLDNKFIKIN